MAGGRGSVKADLTSSLQLFFFILPGHEHNTLLCFLNGVNKVCYELKYTHSGQTPHCQSLNPNSDH